MKGLKFAILVVGLVGAVASFLPFVGDLSFWKYAEVADRAVKAYVVVGGFGLAALVALLAIARGGLARVHGVLALVGFALTLVPDEVRKGFDVGTLGGKLLLIAGALGVLISLVAVVKPEP
jgi:hypothetical protein